MRVHHHSIFETYCRIILELYGVINFKLAVYWKWRLKAEGWRITTAVVKRGESSVASRQPDVSSVLPGRALVGTTIPPAMGRGNVHFNIMLLYIVIYIIAYHVQLILKCLIFLLNHLSAKKRNKKKREREKQEETLINAEKHPKKCSVMKFRGQRLEGGNNQRIKLAPMLQNPGQWAAVRLQGVDLPPVIKELHTTTKAKHPFLFVANDPHWLH